jgi:hypothetical protein
MVVDPSRLRRGRLICGGGDSSTEGETRLPRARLSYEGGDFSTEGETRPCRERLFYGGGESSTQEALASVSLNNMKCMYKFASVEQNYKGHQPWRD